MNQKVIWIFSGITGAVFGSSASLIKNSKEISDFKELTKNPSLTKIKILDWYDPKWSEVTPAGISVTDNKRWCLNKIKNENYPKTKTSKNAVFLNRCTPTGIELKGLYGKET